MTHPTLFRIFMNCFPLYFATGGKIISIARDWKKIQLRLSLNIWTRNYVGTIFGGSMFSASDPFYMIMFIQTLGKGFVVWDKGATIRFKRPGKGKLLAQLEITDQELDLIKQKTKLQGEMEFSKKINWVNQEGKIVCEIDRVIYVATQDHYRQKQSSKNKAIS